MNAKDALRSSAHFSSLVLKGYLGDFEDAELLKRPTEGCNHPAYQLGHLISSEVMLLEMVAPGKGIELPEGFAERYAKENSSDDDASHFETKATYMELYDKVRENSMAVLEAYLEEDFDKESPEQMRDFCPTMGDMWTLIATHPMMHAGQFVPLRRQLGKPIVM